MSLPEPTDAVQYCINAVLTIIDAMQRGFKKEMLHTVKHIIIQRCDICIIYEVTELATNFIIFIFLYVACHLVLNYVLPRVQNVL